VPKGARLQVAASARLNPDIDALGRLDLIAQGDVVGTERANGSDKIELRKELTADHSMWIAVRATGAREVAAQGPIQELGAIAHSAPIYVVVDGQPFWKTEAVPELVRTERQILQDLVNGPVDPMGDLEAWETVNVLAPQWERQRYLLRARVQEADSKYQDILKRATGARPSAAQARVDSLWLGGFALFVLLAIRGRRPGKYKVRSTKSEV
jgi:hypothetical protein